MAGWLRETQTEASVEEKDSELLVLYMAQSCCNLFGLGPEILSFMYTWMPVDYGQCKWQRCLDGLPEAYRFLDRNAGDEVGDPKTGL